MMGSLNLETSPVIDIEVTGGLSGSQIIDAAQAWIDVVEADVGVAPLVYTAPGWWDGNVGSAALGAYLGGRQLGRDLSDRPRGWSDSSFTSSARQARSRASRATWTRTSSTGPSRVWTRGRRGPPNVATDPQRRGDPQ